MPSIDRVGPGARPLARSRERVGERDKPVLALVHGWGMNARVFDGLAERLAPGFDVYAHNLPGHGGRAALPLNTLQSWADDLAQALPDRALLLGWSLGGQVAMRAALDHPGKVARLILLSSTPKFVASADWAAGMADSDLRDFGAALLADPHATLLRFLSLQTRGAPEQKNLLQHLRQSLLALPQADVAALSSGLTMLRETDLRAELARLSQPTLVVHGQLDTLIPPAAGAWLAAVLPAARHIGLARAAHAPHLSHRAEVLAGIRGFAHG